MQPIICLYCGWKSFTYVGKNASFLEELKREYGNLDIVSRKFSEIMHGGRRGVADIYPRYAPTMEWDTAAGQAIAEFSGAQVIDYETKKSLVYNKQELKNPWFTVKGIKLDKKQKYQNFIDKLFVPVFMQNWWLDAIDSSWDVVLLENANGVYAAWPFVKMKRKFLM